MPTVTPHLWFDQEAKAAAAFYVSVFGQGSKVKSASQIHETPSGTVDIVAFELLGQGFMAISAGPHFKFNPSLSFMVNFDRARDPDARAHLDAVWDRLVEGGAVLMPLEECPISERYGWLEDKYGLSWQLILTDPESGEWPQILPSLMFVGDMHGRAEEAVNFYLSVFQDSKMGGLVRYRAGQEPDVAGTVMFADFKLSDLWFAAMDSAYEHGFAFNEAISFTVRCDDQQEIDYYWEKLSAVPEAEQCGWLKDRFGISWQIVPAVLDEIISGGNREVIARVTEAFLKMKKFDIQALQRAYEGDA